MTRYFTDNFHRLLSCLRGSGKTSRAAARRRLVWAIPPSTDSSRNFLLHAPLSTCRGATLYFKGKLKGKSKVKKERTQYGNKIILVDAMEHYPLIWDKSGK